MRNRLLLFKALADGTRLRIVESLLGGERCVCRIYPLVKRSQPAVSLQLGKLEGLGIVKQRRDGKYRYYSIADQRVKKVLEALGARGDRYGG